MNEFQLNWCAIDNNSQDNFLTQVEKDAIQLFYSSRWVDVFVCDCRVNFYLQQQKSINSTKSKNSKSSPKPQAQAQAQQQQSWIHIVNGILLLKIFKSTSIGGDIDCGELIMLESTTPCDVACAIPFTTINPIPYPNINNAGLNFIYIQPNPNDLSSTNSSSSPSSSKKSSSRKLKSSFSSNSVPFFNKFPFSSSSSSSSSYSLYNPYSLTTLATSSSLTLSPSTLAQMKLVYLICLNEEQSYLRLFRFIRDFTERSTISLNRDKNTRKKLIEKQKKLIKNHYHLVKQYGISSPYAFRHLMHMQN